MASESKEEPELPVMRRMYAIINIIDLLHDIIPSRGGPGADVVQNLTLGDDIDFNVLYDLIPDSANKKKVITDYNKQPPVYATLRNLLIAIASIITGENVSNIEDAGCICIGEIKSKFGYFGGRNPYLSYEDFEPKVIMKSETLPESFKFQGPSDFVLNRILKLNHITHWFTEATGNAQDYLNKAVRDISEVEEAIAVASGVDPGPKISGNPENNSLYNLSVDPVLGNIIVRFNEGRYTVEFGDKDFSGIVINRLPNTCLATAIASLIPNLMRHITNRRQEQPRQVSLGTAYNSSEPEYQYHNNSQSSTNAAALPPPNPQTKPLPPFEEYLQGKPINGNTIETHINEWATIANKNSLTSKNSLNYLIKLVKTYIMNATKSGRADIKEYDEYDPAYNPEDSDIEEEEKEAIAAFTQFIRDLCDEQSALASDAGGKAKRARICDVECDNLDKNELINICKLALAILKKCLSTGGTFKDRIQIAIKTILRLKSWGDRLQMEELMTRINIGDTCAIASKDKLFLANCILYANITGRHIITVEYFKRGEKYFMSIINHDGSRGASLTDEQREEMDRLRAAAEAERAKAAAERAVVEDAERKVAKATAAAERKVREAQEKYEGANYAAKGYSKGPLYEAAAKAASNLATAQKELDILKGTASVQAAAIEISNNEASAAATAPSLAAAAAAAAAEQPRRSLRKSAPQGAQFLDGHRCDDGAPWQYNLIPAPANNNCLFGAIIIALLGMYTQDGETELRRRVVEFMRNNREIYDDPMILELGEGNLDNYIANMGKNGVWGGVTEIITLEMILGRCINVWTYNITNKCYELWYGNGNPDCLNIYYNGVDHYDALLPVGRADVLPVDAIVAAAAAAPRETPAQRRAKILAALKKRGVSGGFRSHRQRKTLKKRKDRRFTRRT